jgi:hypothetical protein
VLARPRRSTTKGYGVGNLAPLVKSWDPAWEDVPQPGYEAEVQQAEGLEEAEDPTVEGEPPLVSGICLQEKGWGGGGVIHQ